MLDKEALARAVAAADAKRDGHDLALLVTSASYMSVAHRIAEAILAEIAAQGYAIVPVVPTEAMVGCTVDRVFDGAIEDASIIGEIYTAMLLAAGA